MNKTKDRAAIYGNAIMDAVMAAGEQFPDDEQLASEVITALARVLGLTIGSAPKKVRIPMVTFALDQIAQSMSERSGEYYHVETEDTEGREH